MAHCLSSKSSASVDFSAHMHVEPICMSTVTDAGLKSRHLLSIA